MCPRYGLDPNEDYESRKLHASRFFCDLCAGALKEFNALMCPATYPAGALLFLEKGYPRGVFVLWTGQVKLSLSSSAGKTLILRIAKAGEILGLVATMSGNPFTSHLRHIQEALNGNSFTFK
jgi:CRP/FNR family transcriptional regulator, cyclic AMP receptor protein